MALDLADRDRVESEPQRRAHGVLQSLLEKKALGALRAQSREAFAPIYEFMVEHYMPPAGDRFKSIPMNDALSGVYDKDGKEMTLAEALRLLEARLFGLARESAIDKTTVDFFTRVERLGGEVGEVPA